MTEITLSQKQQDALAWLVSQLCEGQAPLVALRGYAGAGKSVLVPFLRDALVARGLQVSIGAPTHRAAMILRQKGLSEANTVHSLALTPVFTADYTRALRWLGEDTPLPEGEPPLDDKDGLPWLVYEAVAPDVQRGKALLRQRQQYKAKRLLASIGVSGKDFFTGFRARAGEGVLLLDEASMVGTAMLALCQQAFKQVCLIGDPGQLPPVKDTAQLAEAPGMTLTEVHRQAADSPILRLATRTRNGETFWLDRLTTLGEEDQGDILECASADASVFLTAPLIVWRNSTRLECTKAIRAMLGYPATALAVGEPLVCRSTDKEDRALGWYNNGLYRVTAIDTANPRLVTLEDALGEVQEVQAHLEELDGTSVDPKAVPFRFGYALTAHVSQGGEWPTVYLSLPDLKAYAAFAQSHARTEEIRQWSYTAITRAKHTLCFLTAHRFTAPLPQEETAMPSFAGGKITKTAKPAIPQESIMPDPRSDLSDAAQQTTPPDPDVLDDIADPPTPPAVQTAIDRMPQGDTWGAHEALLFGAAQAIQGRLGKLLMEQQKCLEGAYNATFANTVELIKEWLHSTVLTQQRADLNQAVFDALAARPAAPPYGVTVQALSPQGYVVQFRVEKADAASLVEEVGRLTGWLAAQQYTALPSAVAF